MTNVAYAYLGAQNELKEPHVAELEEGYIRLATALLEAMAGADLTKRQFKVLLAVIRLTYGWHKPYDRIANSQISEIAKLPIKKVSEARVQLLKLNVLRMVGQQIGPNKNISEWNDYQDGLPPKSGDENPPKQGIPQNGGLSPKSGDQKSPKMGYSHPPKRGDTKDIIPKIEKINNKNILPEQVRSVCEKNLTEPAQTNPVEEAFEKIFWCAGMVKTGKKKALSAFSSQFRMWRKETGGDAEEFACMLAEDIRSRLAGKQFGFDKLYPTTYLTGQRWMDEIEKPAEEMPKPKFDTRHFTEEQRREWVLYELLEGR